MCAVLGLGLVLAACAPVIPDEGLRVVEPDLVTRTGAAPPEAAPGTCWGRLETPAMIETVTEQRPDASAPDAWRIETVSRILRDRRVDWFETPCPVFLDPATITALQRALAVRGLYLGPATGMLDAPTRDAVRRFQAPQGLDTGELSLAAARQLGILPVGLERTGG